MINTVSYSFFRGTKKFKLEISLENSNYRQVMTDTFGEPTSKCDETRIYYFEDLNPTATFYLARYIRFTALSHYYNGAGLMNLKMYEGESFILQFNIFIGFVCLEITQRLCCHTFALSTVSNLKTFIDI